MTDELENEDEEGEDELDEGGEDVELSPGSFYIADRAKFFKATHSLGIHVTEEGGVWLIDAETLKLRALLIDDGKGGKSKLTRIQ